jgi:hypothetical protein
MERPLIIMRFIPKLLWFDCSGGALVGVLVLLFGTWLSRLEGLPLGVLLFTRAANLVYAVYSFSLAVRAVRPMALVKGLAMANMAWAPVCTGLLAAFSGSATPFGFAHLAGEAVFVGVLGAIEWRYRHVLASEN